MFYILKYIHGSLILVMVINAISPMDPKKSLLDLPDLALVKILADEKLKVKDRKRLMQTCHQLHCMTSPKNLLETTIPLNLFRNINWPLCTLKTAVKSGNLDCCLYILDTQQTNVEKFKKTFAYKIAQNKFFYKNRSHYLNFRRIQSWIPNPSYSFLFHKPDNSYYLECPRNPAKVIPLVTDKNRLIALFKTCGYPEIAENYAQVQNIQELKYGKMLARREGIVYPPNILGHACVFGNVQLLKKIVSDCRNFDDLLMYSAYPASVLALAAEYHQPECFKLLYETPWLKEHFCLYSHFPSKYQFDNYRESHFYNHLEEFIFYYHDKKIIETLLKTGCFNINKNMHYICVKRDGKEYCASNKIPPGKTLLDIILEEKNNPKKKYIQARKYRSLDPQYCEHIAQLLRKHGGKTAQEIAAIHPFNDYFIDDIQKYIIYRLRLLDQHKLRLVCSQWKKTIDDNPVIAESSWGLELLRTSKETHSCFRNSIRVLLGAIYHQDHHLTKTIFQSFQKNNIVCNTYFMHRINHDLKIYRFSYDMDDFIQNPITIELIKKYKRLPFIVQTVDATLLSLIVAALLNDTVELGKILIFLKQELINSSSTFVQQHTDLNLNFNDYTQKVLQHACLILADYDYHEGIGVVVDIFKDNNFFRAFFNDLVLATHALKSPKALEVLLSSGININTADNQNRTIKDKIITQNKVQFDKKYIAYVKVLLNKYGAKTYRENLRSI